MVRFKRGWKPRVSVDNPLEVTWEDFNPLSTIDNYRDFIATGHLRVGLPDLLHHGIATKVGLSVTTWFFSKPWVPMGPIEMNISRIRAAQWLHYTTRARAYLHPVSILAAGALVSLAQGKGWGLGDYRNRMAEHRSHYSPLTQRKMR